jgi:hypothetical protein
MESHNQAFGRGQLCLHVLPQLEMEKAFVR